MSKPGPKLSPWAVWAKDRVAKGLCVNCGRKAFGFRRCERCRKIEADRKQLATAKRRISNIEPLLSRTDAVLLSEAFTDSECDVDNETANLTEAAPIVAEICERLHELEEIKLGLAIDIFSRLNRVCEISHMAFRYTVRLMHGDATIFDSFQQQAKSRAMSKQAAHAEFQTILQVIERAFPELAHQISHIRNQVTRAEEYAHQGIVVTAERSRRHEL